MKFLVLVGDGMADFPLDDRGGRTPLELASCPAMDHLAQHGALGILRPIPDGLEPGSDVGNLSLFGYDPRRTFTGRAPLEAAARGIALSEHQVAFRCNFVTTEDGLMSDFTAGHISTPEAASLIDALNDALSGLGVTFHTGVSYRHLAVFDAAPDLAAGLLDVNCTPPHDITNRPYREFLPQGGASGIVREAMRKSEAVLEGHPGTAARAARGDVPATAIWLWGQGRPPTMPTYAQRFGLTGAVISAVDLVKGIGVCAGLEPIHVPGATGYLDTDYAGKVAAATQALHTLDFAFLHVEAPDEAAHEGRTDLKIHAIEDFDGCVVAPCIEFARRRGDVRILVAPDHITSLASRTHEIGPVPFVAWGPGIDPCPGPAYTEAAAVDTGFAFQDGHTLLPFFLEGGA